MDKHSAIVTIVDSMTEQGFMSGMLGDTSEDFKADQCFFLANLSREALHAWLLSNHFNLTHYCDCRAEATFLMEH